MSGYGIKERAEILVMTREEVCKLPMLSFHELKNIVQGEYINIFKEAGLPCPDVYSLDGFQANVSALVNFIGTSAGIDINAEFSLPNDQGAADDYVCIESVKRLDDHLYKIGLSTRSVAFVMIEARVGWLRSLYAASKADDTNFPELLLEGLVKNKEALDQYRIVRRTH